MFSKKINKSNRMNGATASVAMFEALEGRAMYSASPIGSVAAPAGSVAAPTLTYNGTSGSDEIKVFQSGNTIGVYGDGYFTQYTGPFSSITIHAGAGNDTVGIDKSVTEKVIVYGDSGNDVLTTGASNGTLYAGTGNSNLISLGGKNNKLVCGSGYDNVWMTGSNTYTAGSGKNAVHTIGSFINTKTTSLDFSAVINADDIYYGTDHDGVTFAEPKTDTQTKDTGGWCSVNGDNASGNAFPLFGPSGPQMNDIRQGEAGTCYFLSSLAEVAKRDAQRIRNIITPLGDGTYAEQFFNAVTHKVGYVRVDGYLPFSAANTSELEYDKLGPASNGNDTWAPLMEKGWAYFRASQYGKAASYGYAESGFGSQGLTALGGTGVINIADHPELYNTFTATTELQWIASQLSTGKAVEAGILKTVTGQLCAQHEYSVISVGTVNGHYGIWLRNPWSVDTEEQTIAASGHNDGKNDGYVFIYADTFFSDCDDLSSEVV